MSPKKEVAEKPHPAEDIVKPAMTHPDKVADKGQATKPNNKSAWQGIKDSVANASEKQCTQAQIAMSQCHWFLCCSLRLVFKGQFLKASF